MLDNLRDQSSSSPFFQDEEPDIPELEPKRPAARRRRKQFLGMTPVQRFVMAFMLMLVVCLMGAMFLFVTGRFWLA